MHTSPGILNMPTCVPLTTQAAPANDDARRAERKAAEAQDEEQQVPERPALEQVEPVPAVQHGEQPEAAIAQADAAWRGMRTSSPTRARRPARWRMLRELEAMVDCRRTDRGRSGLWRIPG